MGKRVASRCSRLALGEVREVTERWRRIPGWPGYAVSTLGRVKSLPRIALDGRRCQGKILRPGFCGKYLVVTLADGRLVTQYVHRLVLLAFRGQPKEGQEARHLDGDHLNNRLRNLRWGSRSCNHEDLRDHGRSLFAKLDWQKVNQIRRSKNSIQELACQYNVSESCISRILTGKSWTPCRGGGLRGAK